MVIRPHPDFDPSLSRLQWYVHTIILLHWRDTQSRVLPINNQNQNANCILRLTCAWQYFGTLIFELFFEIIRSSVDKINFLFLC